MAKRLRLDKLMVDRGLAASRQRAQEMIAAGVVKVDGLVATKPSTQVGTDRPVTVQVPDHPWVSRGALKLLGALASFPTVNCEGAICADLGSSTGGFTEVLLKRGAERVYAVDVGTKLLHYRLREHPQIVMMEGTNARNLASLPEPIDLIVGDLSFISFTLIVPTVVRLLRPGGEAVVLVKPQFEAGREHVARGGVVRDGEARTKAIERVRIAAIEAGLVVLGGADSTVAGAKKGNIEHFLHLRRSKDT